MLRIALLFVSVSKNRKRSFRGSNISTGRTFGNINCYNFTRVFSVYKFEKVFVVNQSMECSLNTRHHFSPSIKVRGYFTFITGEFFMFLLFLPIVVIQY